MDKVVTIFAGPSLYGTGITGENCKQMQLNGPARRGDIKRLVEESMLPGVIALADGTFHSYPAVSHVEIRNAVSAGWRVYGLCSMGAIRAAEMSHMGVVPWGKVAKMYCQFPETPDDEVALVHQDGFPYLPLSEPLIHIRFFLSEMLNRKLVRSSVCEEVLKSLSNTWYKDRTIKRLRTKLLDLHNQKLNEKVLWALDNFHAYRLKQHDLVSFLDQKPWQGVA